MLYGLTARGTVGSESCTELGTVSIIRMSSLPQRETKFALSAARARMVTFPSAAKIRASELVVVLLPIASGLLVVFCSHSVALCGRCKRIKIISTSDVHAVIEDVERVVEVHHAFCIRGANCTRNGMRKVYFMDPSHSVSTGN
jgi:hypothetical protein